MENSLFKACKYTIQRAASSTQNVGKNSITIEYYTQDDVDKNVLNINRGISTSCTFGDDDESKIVLVASKTLTIPSGFSLTTVDPKIALVLIADTLIINGSVSTESKIPQNADSIFSVLSPFDGYSEDIKTTDSGNLIIFCNKLINNGVITSDLTRDLYLFYDQYTNNGTIGSCRKVISTDGVAYAKWAMPDIFKEQKKKFTQSNWAYLFGEYISRFNQEE